MFFKLILHIFVYTFSRIVINVSFFKHIASIIFCLKKYLTVHLEKKKNQWRKSEEKTTISFLVFIYHVDLIYYLVREAFLRNVYSIVMKILTNSVSICSCSGLMATFSIKCQLCGQSEHQNKNEQFTTMMISLPNVFHILLFFTQKEVHQLYSLMFVLNFFKIEFIAKHKTSAVCFNIFE